MANSYSELLTESPDLCIQDMGSSRRRPFALAWTLGLSAGMVGAFIWLASRPLAASQSPKVRTVAILDLTDLGPSGPAGPPPPPSRPAAPAPAVAPTPTPVPEPQPVQDQVPEETPTALPTTPAPPVQPVAPSTGIGHPHGVPGGRGIPGGTTAGTGGGGTGKGTGGAIAPRFDADYLKNPAPNYPSRARRFREEGKVLLRVLVSPEGNPLKVELRNSSGYTSLDQEALSTVQRWRFLPARLGDETVAAWVLVPIVFSLRS